MIDLTRAQQLQNDAQNNGGHCSNCGSTIKIYKYKANRSLAIMLTKIADRVKESGNQVVNYDDIPVPHALHSQRAKLRQHGLIYKHKENGHHVANMWGITAKGWNWLKGDPIPVKVIVYNNQVLGHEGGTITIGQALGEQYDPTIYTEMALTEPAARTFADIRKPEYNKEVQAKWLGFTAGDLVTGETYALKMARLQMGRPIRAKIHHIGTELEYKDVAAFAKAWQVVA